LFGQEILIKRGRLYHLFSQETLIKNFFINFLTIKCIVGGCRMLKSASTINAKTGTSVTASYILQKSLQQRWQQLIAVKKKIVNE
jgi:hypothetical protein